MPMTDKLIGGKNIYTREAIGIRWLSLTSSRTNLSLTLDNAGLMFSTAIVVFTYYTIWTLFTPFLPSSSPLINYFPPREWAIRIPALLMLSGLMTIGAFVGLILIKSSRQKVKAKLAVPRSPSATTSTSRSVAGGKDRGTTASSSSKKL